MIKLICTLGPSTLNNKSLKELKNIGVNLFRLNLSHLSITQLKKKISFLKKNNIKNICIDTEGAQIRTTKVQSKIYLKKNYKLNLSSQNETSNKKNIFLYPSIGLKSININTEIEIGFENLKVLVLKNNGEQMLPQYLFS